MWTCRNCGEPLEDTFDACWKCKRRRDGVEEPAADPPPQALRCTRCDRELEYAGTKSLHEGTNWGFLGELGEFFVKRESLDFYVCPRCGRVELYVDGIGEDLRPR
jgi:Zn finger protein HypA/HybF involved in hydrogenase expression